MTDLVVVPQAAHWQRLKRLVLDSVSSPITRRVYNLGLDEFFEWYGREPRPGFTRATVSALASVPVSCSFPLRHLSVPPGHSEKEIVS